MKRTSSSVIDEENTFSRNFVISFYSTIIIAIIGIVQYNPPLGLFGLFCMFFLFICPLFTGTGYMIARRYFSSTVASFFGMIVAILVFEIIAFIIFNVFF